MNRWGRGSQQQEESQTAVRQQISHHGQVSNQPSSASCEPSALSQRLQSAQDQWRRLFRSPSFSVQNIQDNPAPPRKQARKLTVENQRTNVPWGDVLQAKDPLCTRVYVQNVNGISLDRRGGPIQ
jgi:hypothetical protein